MSESFKLIISNLDPLSIGMITLLVVAILMFLPKAVNEMGIKKLGPIQMEQENQTLNHLTNKRIEAIDIENRENLWEATEEYLAKIAMDSIIKCPAAVNSILATVSGQIRTMILLNHIAPKLVFSNQEHLIQKLQRSVMKSFREIKNLSLPDGCPSAEDVSNIVLEKFQGFFPNWLDLARSITVRACHEKIKVYLDALENTRDKHWKSIFESCYNKNLEYIEGMGYHIDKSGNLERS